MSNAGAITLCGRSCAAAGTGGISTLIQRAENVLVVLAATSKVSEEFMSKKLVGIQFEQPSPGQHAAVCADVVMETSQKFGKPQFKFTWFVTERGSDGKPKSVCAWANCTLRPNNYGVPSRLRVMLTQILGRDPGKVFDVEEVVGVHAYLTLAPHQKADGSPSVKIAGYAPLPDGVSRAQIPPDYVRIEERRPKLVTPSSGLDVDQVIGGGQ